MDLIYSSPLLISLKKKEYIVNKRNERAFFSQYFCNNFVYCANTKIKNKNQRRRFFLISFAAAQFRFLPPYTQCPKIVWTSTEIVIASLRVCICRARPTKCPSFPRSFAACPAHGRLRNEFPSNRFCSLEQTIY